MEQAVLARGVDYSERHNDWAAFGRSLLLNGRTFVGRYLSHRPKGATAEELRILRELGIDVFFWWETTETRALGGYGAGVNDCQGALVMLKELGAPLDTPVYYTVDTDTTGRAVTRYFEGIASRVPVSQIGAYGGFRVIEYLFDHEQISYGCQTEAWSYLDGRWPHQPRWDYRAQLRQWTVHQPSKHPNILGISCDELEAVSADFGLWLSEKTSNPKPEPLPDHQPGSRILRLKSPYMTGYDVRWAQRQLNAILLPVGLADGVYGPETVRGVRKFQEVRGLVVDGILGPKTWEKLLKS